MANFYLDNDDLRFYFEKGIDWEQLVGVTESKLGPGETFASPAEAIDFYKEIASLIGELIAEELAPNVQAIDKAGVRLDKESGRAIVAPEMERFFQKVRELDLHRLCLPRELGGMNAPLLLYFVEGELIARGDIAAMGHLGFHGGVALILLMSSILEGSTTWDPAAKQIATTRFAEAIEEITSGAAWGSMDLTEPGAGSDLAALRTVAEQDEQGRWLITGEKIFITSGHAKHHLVLARSEQGVEGLDALSLFHVKAYDDLPGGQRQWHTSFERVEEKLGLHGSVTATQIFDRTPAELLGKRGEGFKYMLMLMNDARIEVGFESIGVSEAALRAAKAYAAERRSMGKTIDRHEMIADYLDEMETDIIGLRALAMAGAFAQNLNEAMTIRLTLDPPADETERKDLERSIKRHKTRARRIVPLLKYLAAEKAVEICRRSLQIHGGNGYMREYGVEKMLRDALVLPIYEGTSQIQALMAMKDTLGAILKKPKIFISRLAHAKWASLSARDPLERRVARVQALSLGAQQHLVTRLATTKMKSLHGKPMTDWPKALRASWNPKRDFAYAMLHAEHLAELLAREVMCDVLFEQAQQHAERRDVLARVLDRCEPRCRYLADLIASTGDPLLARLASSEKSE